MYILISYLSIYVSSMFYSTLYYGYSVKLVRQVGDVYSRYMYTLSLLFLETYGAILESRAFV